MNSNLLGVAAFACASHTLAIVLVCLLTFLVCGCGTKSHDDRQAQPKTEKTTDDGPAVERVPPVKCNG